MNLSEQGLFVADVGLKAQWPAGLAFDMLNASKKSLVKPFHSTSLQDNYLPTEVKKASLESQS